MPDRDREDPQDKEFGAQAAADQAKVDGLEAVTHPGTHRLNEWR